MTDKQKAELHRHIADIEVGINQGTWVVASGKAQLQHVPATYFAKFGGPGVLIVQEGHAVVLERSGRISRIVGAGFYQLAQYERPQMVVYLPSRAERVLVADALTRDKMVVKNVELAVFHRADRGDQSSYSGLYRFDRKVILEKIWSPNGGDWRDAVKAVSDSAARDVIAEYDFDDLVSISGDARRKFLGDLVDRINRITKDFMGVEVIAANLGEITISDEAKRALEEKGLVEVRRRTRVIQAEGEKEAKIKMGEGERVYLRMVGEGEANVLRHKDRWHDIEIPSNHMLIQIAIPAQLTVDSYLSVTRDTMPAVDFVYSVLALLYAGDRESIGNFVSYCRERLNDVTIPNLQLHRFLAAIGIEPLQLASVSYGSPLLLDLVAGVSGILLPMSNLIKDVTWRGKIEKESATVDLYQKKLDAERTKLEIVAKAVETIEKVKKSDLREEDKEVFIHILESPYEKIANAPYPLMMRFGQSEAVQPPNETPEQLNEKTLIDDSASTSVENHSGEYEHGSPRP